MYAKILSTRPSSRMRGCLSVVAVDITEALADASGRQLCGIETPDLRDHHQRPIQSSSIAVWRPRVDTQNVARLGIPADVRKALVDEKVFIDVNQKIYLRLRSVTSNTTDLQLKLLGSRRMHNGKEPKPSKNETNRTPGFAKNRTRTIPRKEQNRTRTQSSKRHGSYWVLSLNESIWNLVGIFRTRTSRTEPNTYHQRT